jgi:hypothetical protein
MRYGTVAAVAAIVALALGAISAEAHTKSIPTQVTIVSIQGSPPDQLVTGTVNSRREKCESRRKVRLYVRDAGQPRELFDVGRSSRNGSFSSRGNLSGADKLIVKVRQKNVGRGRHTHLCLPAKTTRQL